MDKPQARRMIAECAARDFMNTHNPVPQGKHFEFAYDTLNSWVSLDPQVARAVKVLGLNAAACHYAAAYEALLP